MARGDYSCTVAFLAQFGHLTYNLISITSHVTGEKSGDLQEWRSASRRKVGTHRETWDFSSAVRLGSHYGKARRGCLSNVVIHL